MANRQQPHDAKKTSRNQKSRAKAAKREHRHPVWKFFKYASITVGAGFVFCAGSAVGYASSMLKGLPAINPEKFSNLSSASVVYDRNGKVIGSFTKDGDRQPITSVNQVSPYLREAFVAGEDKTFYSNIGINPLAILRASAQDLMFHRVVSGASTITQQTVKLAIFPAQERTAKRKIQEIALALELTHMLTKNEILTDYMNWVYMGRMGSQNVYGVKSGAEVLFHKDPRDLNLAESAFLASIPNNPSYFSPYEFYSHTVDRERRILGEMDKEGMITDSQYRAALKFNMKKDLKNAPNTSSGKYPYIMIDNIEPIVAKDLVDAGVYDNIEEAKEALPTAGYKIYTSIDLSLQNDVDKVLYNNSYFGNTDLPVPGTNGKQMDKYEAGATLIDNQTGGILAIGGGRGYDQDNYDHSDIARQTGSSIKPLVDYGPAIDLHKMTAGTIIDDLPINVAGYKPQNDDGLSHGLVTVRTALTDSMNVPAVKVLQQITPEVGTSYLPKMGISTSSRTILSNRPTLVDSDLHQLATAIGGFSHGLTVQQMTSAYTTFPNQGVWRQSYLVGRIADPNGNTVFQFKQKVNTVFSPQTAYIMTDLLHDVVYKGTGYAVGSHFPGQYISGKTGTTDNLTDGWFVGYTQKYTLGMWMGYNDDQPIPGPISGPVYNLKFKLWNAIMDPILQQDPATAPFPEPSGITTEAICSKSGLLPTSLCKQDGDVYKELFITGTQPTKTCTTHVQVQYVVIGGKKYLATTNTPANEIRTGIFVVPPETAQNVTPTDAATYVPTVADPRGGAVLDGSNTSSSSSSPGLAAPQNVIPTISNTSVTLSWDDVSGATSYSVWRATSPNGPYSNISSSIPVSLYTDNSPPKGAAVLYYQVYAVNGSTMSDPSRPIIVELSPSSPPNGDAVGNQVGNQVGNTTDNASNWVPGLGKQ